MTRDTKAAEAYWAAWREVEVSFAAKDQDAVPEHWRTFGDRRSMITGSPRTASSPIGALLNYGYALAEFECRIALLAMGLDPGLGWSHRDHPYRDSAALDMLEAIRPDVDLWLSDQLSSHIFARRDFHELDTGHIRLAPHTARMVAESVLPLAQGAVAAIAESVARMLSPDGRMIRARLTNADRARGRGKGRARTKIAAGCRECGVVLDDPERLVCDECLRDVDAARTVKLKAAGKAKLAEMRASADDPSKSAEAKAKRGEALRRQWALQKSWDAANPGPHDVERYRQDIWPGLSAVPVAEIAQATGLSKVSARDIRSGRQVPHPRHWVALERL